MQKDEIIAEVWRHLDAYSEKHHYNLPAIVADLQIRQKKGSANWWTEETQQRFPKEKIPDTPYLCIPLLKPPHLLKTLFKFKPDNQD